ncbi:MAG: hypothetical protein N2504_07655 [candidate division WOR-3 bacterium]|nr:hypothetical protein [candidate division WOR-3 bacterium]
MLNDFVLFFITYMPGITGRKLRYFYWSKRFKKCGKNVIIDEGVIIQGAEWISIGDNVWIDKYCILIAGPVQFKENTVYVKHKENKNFTKSIGELCIGNCCHIGARNIIQAHGGVHISDNVTTSAGVVIYSLSNLPIVPHLQNQIVYANWLTERTAYIISPVFIGEGVWIGLNCIILGCSIGNRSFIAPQSVVYQDIQENSYALGFPAVRVKERFKIN